MDKKAKLFLLKNKENGDFNQYWYSNTTIAFLAEQAKPGERCCFLSTPSIYYAIPNPNHEAPLFLFDVVVDTLSTTPSSGITTPTSFSTTSTTPNSSPRSTTTPLTSWWPTRPSSRKRSGRSTLTPSDC